MTETARSERTARILGLRLEELARALERSGASPAAIARLLEAASVATANAVALELLTAERARGIWSETAARHPAVSALREEPRLAA
jgi:soluble lytic murein transglycosylase-like protein